MLNIIGAGCAYPETVIDNQLLGELNPAHKTAGVLERAGIETRRSILPLAYIRETGNGDSWQASKVALESPTDLAVRAARQAIERAGIAAEELGLVIGDCATAFQSAPSEGQRVAGRLGLKIPAYDVFSGQGPVCQHLDMLSSWKEEVLPDYILCISSNCPTYRLNYRRGLEGVYLGDAAAALVVSIKHRGKLAVCGSFFGTDVKLQDVFQLDRFADGAVKIDEFRKIISARSAQMFNALMEKHHLTPGAYRFIGTQFDYGLLEEERIQHGIEPQQCWSNVRACGYTLGSSAASVLADQWAAVQPDQTVAVTHISPGIGFGYLLLRS